MADRVRKLTAGPTPDGGFVSRRTANDYGYAVVILDTVEQRYSRKTGDYVPNPTLNKWVSFSWHTRYDLASKGVDRARGLGCRAALVPVVVPEEN